MVRRYNVCCGCRARFHMLSLISVNTVSKAHGIAYSHTRNFRAKSQEFSGASNEGLRSWESYHMSTYLPCLQVFNNSWRNLLKKPLSVHPKTSAQNKEKKKTNGYCKAFCITCKRNKYLLTNSVLQYIDQKLVQRI